MSEYYFPTDRERPRPPPRLREDQKIDMPVWEFLKPSQFQSFEDLLKRAESFRPSAGLTSALQGAPAAGKALQGFSNFRSPSGFNQFVGQVGTAETQIGGFPQGLQTALGDAKSLTGELRTANDLLGGGSFGGEPFGGIIAEAQDQVKGVQDEVNKLRVDPNQLLGPNLEADLLAALQGRNMPTIDPNRFIDEPGLDTAIRQLRPETIDPNLLLDETGLNTAVRDLRPETIDPSRLLDEGGINTAIGNLLPQQIDPSLLLNEGGIDDAIAGLRPQTIKSDLLLNEGGINDAIAGLRPTQQIDPGLLLNEGDINAAIGNLLPQQINPDLLLNEGGIDDAIGNLRPRRIDAGRLMPGGFDLANAVRDLDVPQVEAGRLLPGTGALEDELARTPIDRLSPSRILPELPGLNEAIQALEVDRIGAGRLLPGEGELSAELRRTPIERLAASRVLPERLNEALRTAVSRLSTDEVLPRGDLNDALQDRVGRLTEDQIFPTGDLNAALGGRVDRLTAGDVLPTGDLNAALRDRVDRLGAGDVLPEGDLGGALRDRVGRLTEDDIFPGGDLNASLRDRVGGLTESDIFPDDLQSILEGRVNPLQADDLIPRTGALADVLRDRRPGLLDLLEFPEFTNLLDERLPEGSIPGIEAQLAGLAEQGGTGGGGTGTGGTGTGTTVPAPATGLDAFLEQLQGVVGNLTTGPETSDELRQDPLTASLLADFEDQSGRDRSQAMEDLQRLGVLGDGDTADVLGELTSGQRRGEFDILGDAAERFRTDRSQGLGAGVDLFGAAGQRELGLGQLGLQGQEMDMAILSQVASLLDPNLHLDAKGGKNLELASILLSLSGLPPDKQAQLRKALGLPPQSGS